VDALAPAAEEGRSHAAKRAGEGLAPGDPAISEWGNPAAVMGRHPHLGQPGREGTGGTETSQYPEEEKGFPE